MGSRTTWSSWTQKERKRKEGWEDGTPPTTPTTFFFGKGVGEILWKAANVERAASVQNTN